MAEEKKVPYIVVNYKAKTFTINDAVKPTKQDEEDITRYLQSGYKMRHKSAKRTEQAKKKALTDEAIKTALKGNADALKEYEDTKKEKGFFVAKALYVSKYAKK